MRPLTAPADVDAPAREARRLSTLLEVSQALSGTLNLKAALHRVLEILARHHGAVRGIVTLLHDDGELRVEASDGLERRRAPVSYRVGEGHHRQGGRERQADRRAARQPRAGVPAPRRAAAGAAAAGAELRLRADQPEPPRRSARWRSISSSRPIATTSAASKFLGVVASMIAQALKIQRLIEEDERRLVDENTHLRQELRERYDFSNIVGTQRADAADLRAGRAGGAAPTPPC